MELSKYTLKDYEELSTLLENKDHLFIIGCNKCFCVTEHDEAPELEAFIKFAECFDKTIDGCARIDFLCNSVQTEKTLSGAIPAQAENVIVISCGLGVQTVSRLTALPVFTASNTKAANGYHGMALTEKTCGACGQCYLNLTGGICPVTDCSKGLLNGPCGGAKGGRCEIDPQKECGWERILHRLRLQGREAAFISQPVQLRDHSKIDRKAIREYVSAVRRERFEGFYGGIHPVEKKYYTEALPLQSFPEPETVVLPLSMHAGAPAVPVVAVGDSVRVGQRIAEQGGFISAPIHSPVSGTVTAIEPHTHPNKGPGAASIVIRSDGKGTLHESVIPAKPLEELTPREIADIVRDKGITGMGGAGFPACVKLMPGKPIDTVIINGSECEPYLTADHRVMLEYPDEIIYGLRAIMKAVGAPRGIILIEDNKPDAVRVMREKASPFDHVEVCCARTQYPEGAEKLLIKRVLNRSVPSGGLPADVGCVVSNASTAKAISDALIKGMPLVERAVCVSGEHVARPGNYLVKLGTSVQKLLAYCGGVTSDRAVIKMGGPMMGTTLTDTDVPVIKGSNGVIAIEPDETEPRECIRCGRCVDVCPMELKPLNFVRLAGIGDGQGLLDARITDCFSCGCCEYVCSSKIPLVKVIGEGKKLALPLLKR